MMHDGNAKRTGHESNTDAGPTLGGTPGKMSLAARSFGGVDSHAPHGEAGAGGVDAAPLHGDAGAAAPAAGPAAAGGAPEKAAPHAATTISALGGSVPMDSSFVSLLAGFSDQVSDPLGAAATSSSATTFVGPSWKPTGEFKWWIKWATDGTSGWIVQKVTNTYSGTRGNGTPITNASVGAHPSYYECWPVSATSVVTTVPGDNRNQDQWERPSMGASSKGSWSMAGEVYWTSTDPAGSGLTPGGASNAGVLLSGFSAPAGLGACLLNRSANGTWDDAAATKVAHNGATS